MCGRRKNARDCNAQCSCFFNGAGQCVPKQLMTDMVAMDEDFNILDANFTNLDNLLFLWGDSAWMSPDHEVLDDPQGYCCNKVWCAPIGA